MSGLVIFLVIVSLSSWVSFTVQTAAQPVIGLAAFLSSMVAIMSGNYIMHILIGSGRSMPIPALVSSISINLSLLIISHFVAAFIGGRL